MFDENLENLFFEELTCGMVLFLGAGFSVLPDCSGLKFPTVEKLCKEVCEKFNIDDIFSDDLYTASEMVPKVEYQNYLRERFTVHNSINKKYFLLDKLNIKSIITTNIDNIVKTIYNDDSTHHYIIDSSLYGNVRKSSNGIDYIALNGDVSIDNSYLYFGKFDLSEVEEKNSNKFNIANSYIQDNPVLFWGYSFTDNGVKKMISYLINHNKRSNIWIQCLPNDKKQITFFRKLGCKVIIADTERLFKWIEYEYLPELEKTPDSSNKYIQELSKYKIPNQFSVETTEKSDYYKLGDTNWYSIFNNHPYETKYVDMIWAKSLINKNLLVLGTTFSGKTTAIMQCATKRNDINVYYLCGDIIKEEVNSFIKSLKGSNAIVFLQDAHKDVESLCLLALAQNIKLIASADSYYFDNIKHILIERNISFEEFHIDKIDIDTARQIYNHIPPNIVRPKFTYTKKEDEDYSYFELLGQNIKDFATYDSVLKILTQVYAYKNNTYGIEILLIALTVYLEINDSLMSTDLFFSFFNLTDYSSQILPLIRRVGNYLHGATDVEYDQDYFSIRSKFFLYHAHKVFTSDEKFKKIYEYVIDKFVMDVNKMNVYRYDIFKRKAYDSSLFFKVFGSNDIKEHYDLSCKSGLILYNYLFEYEESPYTLQQKALYLSLLHRSKEAFAVIDEALSMFPNNFSMKNSKAEIIFNANRSFNTVKAEEQLNKAIEILKECRKKDKKQNYHAILFAKIVIHLIKTFGNTDGKYGEYITMGLEWLDSIDIKDSTINKLVSQLKNIHA